MSGLPRTYEDDPIFDFSEDQIPAREAWLSMGTGGDMSTAFTLGRLTELLEESGDPDSSATVPLEGDIGNVTFEKLGIDSLTLFNTCVEIESIYPVKLSLDDVLAAETPNGLLNLVNQYVGLSA